MKRFDAHAVALRRANEENCLEFACITYLDAILKVAQDREIIDARQKSRICELAPFRFARFNDEISNDFAKITLLPREIAEPGGA